MNKKLLRVIELIATIMIFLAIVVWYHIVSINKTFDAVLFPPIKVIINSFLQDKDKIIPNLLQSIQLLIPSIVLTLAIALVIGSILGLNKIARDSVSPFLYALSCVPSILLSTIVMQLAPSLWWGAVILIIYECVWSILFATITGVQSIDKRYIESAETLKLSKIDTFFKVILPAASPTIMGAFVNSLRSAFTILVYAETYSLSAYGLGNYVYTASKQGYWAKAWWGLIFMVIVVIIIMTIFEKLKDYILRWTID